jgi:predicted transcriptional regulator
MRMKIELPDEAAKDLEQLAARLGISVSTVATMAITDFLRSDRANFTVALHDSLEENKQVFNRLAD